MMIGDEEYLLSIITACPLVVWWQPLLSRTFPLTKYLGRRLQHNNAIARGSGASVLKENIKMWRSNLVRVINPMAHFWKLPRKTPKRNIVSSYCSAKCLTRISIPTFVQANKFRNFVKPYLGLRLLNTKKGLLPRIFKSIVPLHLSLRQRENWIDFY
jgi:hypothetical protein